MIRTNLCRAAARLCLPACVLVALAALLPGTLSAQISSRPPLSKGTTEALVGRYEASEHWVQKVVVILSLNHYWHPVGNQMIISALQDRDTRLRAYGLEALHRCDEKLLPALATTELLDELVGKQLMHSNKYYRKRVLATLKALVPDASATTKNQWVTWWRQAKAEHQPGKWTPREQPKNDGGGTSAAAQRAFDLYQAGLDLMICIDSTGSMQPTIDALAAALGEMAGILDGISPKFRLGIVHYKDHGELGKTGAKVIQSLNKNVKSARTKLEKLRAMGGGDLPEAVLGGLQLALSKKMKWKPEANKITIVIGDAPPHLDETDVAVELAKAAYEKPGSQNDKKPTTGARKKQSSFLTSAIGVLLKLGPEVKFRSAEDRTKFMDSQKRMSKDLKAIADAGGGVFVEVEFEVKGGPPPTSKERRAMKKKGGSPEAKKATRAIVEHILVLSFGKRFELEMKDFVRILYEYKEGSFFK